eukprot:4191938-Prymnesium_polylepis.1
MRLARLGRDLLAVRSPMTAEALQPGQLLALGDGTRASVLCARGGIHVASVLPKELAGAAAALPEGTDATMLPGEVLSAPLGGGGALGGRIVDYLGRPLDGGAPPVAST